MRPEIAPASSVESEPIAINLNPRLINFWAATASAAKIPATLLLSFAAATTLVIASINIGLSNSRGTPNAKLKSSGPTNNISAPSIPAISSISESADSVSI